MRKINRSPQHTVWVLESSGPPKLTTHSVGLMQAGGLWGSWKSSTADHWAISTSPALLFGWVALLGWVGLGQEITGLLALVV